MYWYYWTVNASPRCILHRIEALTMPKTNPMLNSLQLEILSKQASITIAVNADGLLHCAGKLCVKQLIHGSLQIFDLHQGIRLMSDMMSTSCLVRYDIFRERKLSLPATVQYFSKRVAGLRLRELAIGDTLPPHPVQFELTSSFAIHEDIRFC